ncbi:MAG: TetR/AcrR family transcriptional regulator [Pseudomonadota bacterium]
MARTIAHDHDEKRAQILNTAANVFAAQGFDGASMTRIAAACGISKANIYHYFPSKQALLFTLLDEYLSDLRNRVLAADQPAAPPADRLKTAITVILRAYQGADDHHRVVLSSLKLLSRPEQDLLRAYQRDLVTHVSALLRAIAGPTLDDGAKLRATTMSVFGMLNWFSNWNSGAGPDAREAYATLVTTLTLSGVRGV